MTNPWLTIVGIGEDGLDGLSTPARAALDEAEIFVGGNRHLAMLDDDKRRRLPWASPLKKTVATIRKLKNRQVCVLASGDPMHYGIGVTLAREFGMDAVQVIPHLSAFSLAAARLGWPLAETVMVTLHGRPLNLLKRHLADRARLLILSENGETPKQVAALLRECGYGDSRLHVFEHMASASEKRFDGSARTWRRKTRDLNTIAVDCVADAKQLGVYRGIGLPNDAFIHDGQLTKQDIRAMTIAALAPQPYELLWDVGAGCGSIAIEFLLQHQTARAIAVENHHGRLEMIRHNAETFGMNNLEVVAGTAPEALRGLPTPDVVFLGGGITNAKVVKACWRALDSGGRLIANAVTSEGEAAILKMRDIHGGDVVRLSVSHMQPLGKFQAWDDMRAVVQYRGMKR